MMFLVLNLVVTAFLATVLSCYNLLWIINYYTKWWKWHSTCQTCMSKLLTEAKRKMLLVINCLSWSLDFCLFLSCLSIDFYTRTNIFWTSVSLILASSHKNVCAVASMLLCQSWLIQCTNFHPSGFLLLSMHQIVFEVKNS